MAGTSLFISVQSLHCMYKFAGVNELTQPQPLPTQTYKLIIHCLCLGQFILLKLPLCFLAMLCILYKIMAQNLSSMPDTL